MPGPARPFVLSLRSYEFWFVVSALLLTAIIPGFAKYQGTDADASSAPNEILWSTMYVFAAWRLFRTRELTMLLIGRTRIVWAFLALILVTTLWSVEPMITFTNAIELVGTTLVGYYIVTRFTLTQFMSILTITFAVIGLLSFGFIFGAPAHGRMDWGAGAWSGIYQEKNNLAAVAALAVVSQLILLTQLRGRARITGFLALAVFVILLVGANSATAFVDAAAVLGVSFALLGCRSRRYRSLTWAALLVSAIALTVTVCVTSTDALFSLVGRQSNLTGRADFWPYLQAAIADRPVFGYGYNAFFRSAIGKDDLANYVIQAGGWSPYHAHNSFLQITLDAGYIGLAALVLLVLIALLRGIMAVRRDASPTAVWPFAIVLYLLLGSFTETYLARGNTMEWILFTAAFLYPLRGAMSRPRALTPQTSVSARDRLRARIIARRESRPAATSGQAS